MAINHKNQYFGRNSLDLTIEIIALILSVYGQKVWILNITLRKTFFWGAGARNLESKLNEHVIAKRLSTKKLFLVQEYKDF